MIYDRKREVLNLVINGIPSILLNENRKEMRRLSFKPCYKWNTFNTFNIDDVGALLPHVLNLVINGIPSIPLICIRILILW